MDPEPFANMATTPPLLLSLSLLRPWLDTLHALNVHPTPAKAASSASSTSSPRVRLVWHLPTGPSRSDMTKYLEAIELLVLLAWTDANAWMEAGTLLRGDGSNHRIAHLWTSFVLDAPSPAAVDGHTIMCSSADDACALCNYLVSPETKDDALSPEYYAVRATLEAAMGLIESKVIPVRLLFNPFNPWGARSLDALAFVAAVAATQHTLRDGSGDVCRLVRLCSRIDEFHDGNFMFTTANEECLGRLAELWSHGIRVLELPRRLQLPPRPHNSSLYVEALHALLGIGQEGCVQDVFFDRRGPANSVSTLLSALAHSTSVRQVLCGFGSTEEGEGGVELQRRDEMLYLAYALFRADISNNIDKISLWCRNLTMEHVSAMRQVLEADDPLIGLFPELATSIQAHQDLRITASSLRLDGPTASSTEPVTTRSDLVFKNLRVLNAIGDYWIVFLPGWGQARVRLSQGVITEGSRVIPVAPKIRSIAQLWLDDFSPGNEVAVVNLLRLVGTNVKALSLGDHDHDRKRDTSCVEILSACANLEHLELNESAYHRLAVVAESFASGCCPRLKSLKLRIQFVEGTPDEIAQMLGVLADKHHPMTKQLEQLEIHISRMMDGPEPAESAVLDRALHMLESSKYLTCFKLRLPIAVRDAATIERLKRAFAAHHDVLIPVRVAPLSGRHKAAFLSVVWSKATMSTASATQQFDARMISRIWVFAPERRRRLLDVAMPQLLEVAED